MSELPDRPDLDQLRRQARELLRAATDGEPRALARIRSVSDRTTLSAAQLALAREYGFPSWPALRIGAEHRRRMSEPAEGSPHRDRHWAGHVAGERWSFGGASAIDTAAGVLDPGALLIGLGHAALDASLMPSPETRRRLAGPHREKIPGLRFVAALLGRTQAHSEMPRFDDVVVADDRGTRYSLAFESGSIPREEPGQVRGPIELRLCLEPVPPRDCGWLELRGHGGSTARLLPSARPALRVGQLGAVSGNPAEGELTERCSATLAPDAAHRTDGPAYHMDIAAGLRAVDGTAVQLDSLVSEPGSWRVHLRARPGWWRLSTDHQSKRAAMSVQAEDNLGGKYLSSFGGGGTTPSGHEEVALVFRPRLDPLARAMKLTFTGPSEQLSVTVALDSADKSETR